MQRSSSFLGLQKSLNCPIDLSVHSLLVTEDPVHILLRREGVVVEARIRSVSFDPDEALVHGVEEPLPICDVSQKLLVIDFCFKRLVILFRLNPFAFFDSMEEALRSNTH